jgi:arylformamidase
MEIIDLTYPIEEGMITFPAPWHPVVEITQLGHQELEGRQTTKITLGSHTGTHMDAPLHFFKKGLSIDNIPLAGLIGPTSIIDFSNLKQNEPVTVSMLKNIGCTERMIFKFGWGKYWNSMKFYRGYPYISLEAAAYLVEQGVKLIAMDTPSPDDSRIDLDDKTRGTDIDSPAHKVLLQSNVIIVEYLANTHEITDYENWKIVVMPLKIKGSDGSPVRVCIFR